MRDKTTEQQSFNSILVRLKVSSLRTNPEKRSEFQFHTGSIKRVDFIVYHLFEIRFNSILVRLKVTKKTKTQTALNLFQFHTGSIKRF